MVICDFYNANPSSMAAALKNLTTLASEHKVAIIGDMFELGEESGKLHEEIAALSEISELDSVLLIGKYFYSLKDKYKGNFFSSPEEAAIWLQANPVKDSLVLLKGSRGMALEQLLPFL
jgi:UDP-N-acetylmuramoyl-tripeptide--D-alanyl-D-alanine ligase